MFTVHKVSSPREELALKRCMASAFGPGSLEGAAKRVSFIRKYFGADFLVIADTQDCVAASGLCAAPCPVYIDRVPVPQASIGLVATRAAYRKQGMAEGCLRETHRLLRDRDIPLSCLWPFAYFFYRKYGWEIGGSALECSAAPEAFDHCEAAPLFFESGADTENIIALHARCFSRYNGSNVRSRFWWREYPYMFAHEILRGAYIRDGKGCPAAGCLYYERERDGRRYLELPEIYYSRHEDMRLLMGGLRKAYPDMGFDFRLPPDTDLFRTMPDPRLVRRTLVSGHMLRVHDPAKALAYLKPRNSGTLSFCIRDPFEEEPHRFTVIWDGPGPQVTGYTGVNPVETSAGPFSQLYCGAVKLTPDNYPDYVSCSEEAAALLTDLMPVNGAYRSSLDPG